ncbi:MAG: SGNH/GDSL hydrolase family protein [Eubacteriales bacterium]|jgi:lysophospholipase L1-like esterase
MKILFMGDSITDAGRNTERGSGVSMGQGYPILVNARLSVLYPGKLKFINNGISGNRIVDLYARIKCDVWNHAPDVLSVLIGVNDVWHELGGKNGVDAVRFERMLAMFCEDTLERLPDIKIILMEPFVLKAAATEGNWDYFDTETKLRAAAVKRVAEKFNLVFLPLQGMYDEACKIAPADYWIPDGVHPSPAGHQLIADKWIETFQSEIIK